MTLSSSKYFSEAGTDIALFLLSAVLIASQVVLMQALARSQGYHFAYIVISLALIGFGCSGTVITLGKRWMSRHAGDLLPGFMFMAGLCCLFAFPAALSMVAKSDSNFLFLDWRGWIPLLVGAFFAFLPFFFGALVIGLVFVRDSDLIGRRYGANLLGSASGGGLGILLLFRLPPENIFPLFSCLIAVAVLCIAISVKSTRGSLKFCLCSSILAVLGFGAALITPESAISSYKGISHALLLPEVRITNDEPHPMGRVQIVESPALRYGPGLSLHFRGELPAPPHLYVNGDAYGVMLSPTNEISALLEHSLQNLPLVLANPQRALVINAGAGSFVSHLLSRGIPFVEVIEPHPAVALIVEKFYGSFLQGTILLTHARDGRSFIKASPCRYDLIMLPVQGTFGGGLGVQSLRENYLLTEEAFQAIWNALEAEGFLSVSVYNDQPPRQTLKILSLLVSAMKKQGIEDPSGHIAALRSWEMLTMVASPSPMVDSDRERLAVFAETLGFDRTWIPGKGPALNDSYHVMEDDRLNDGFIAIIGGRDEEFIESYPFMIDVPTDDRPFFHQFLRLNRLPETMKLTGGSALVLMETGSFIVVITVLLLAAVTFFLILAPLLYVEGAAGGKRAPFFVFLYFSSLGLGFMFLEIMWIQRLTLFWGHTLYSAAGVISALLCGMGIGSIAAPRISPSKASLSSILIILLCVVAASHLLLPPLFQASLGLPGYLKWLLGFCVIAVPAFIMGMPFPLALRRVAESHSSLAPWAWGINGFFSVLAPPLAVLAAINCGFAAVGWLALAAYGVALASATSLHVRRAGV
ncbi:MAG: hypothetical protein PHU03_05625 [Syntrophales bacterium]|nr:hypothetical protein [Syntrophales bacterium]